MGGRGTVSGIVKRTPNYRNAAIANEKIEHYLLKNGTDHYKEFIDVGYSSDNPKQLKKDLLNGIAGNEAIETNPNGHGAKSYTVYMKLGVTKKRTFKTIWQIDNKSINPRFITAYRVKKRGG